MVFKYVAVALLGVGALGATYVARTGGCSAPAAADTAPSATIGVEDCEGCPMSGSTGIAANAIAEDAPAGCPMSAASALECAEQEDCAEACEDPCDKPCDSPCDKPCDTPCDSRATEPAESTPSD